MINSSLKKKFKKTHYFFIIGTLIFFNSCSTIESSWDSVKDAGSYMYDSVTFWEDEEPEENQAIIIEEAYEIPQFAESEVQQNMGNQRYAPQQFIQPQSMQPSFQPLLDPIYRSARQYYFVSPNGSPMPAPPPPPFPQYSIDRNNSMYVLPSNPVDNNFGNFSNALPTVPYLESQRNQDSIMRPTMTPEEEMELYGIENNCIRVTTDYMNGGYMCDDFD